MIRIVTDSAADLTARDLDTPGVTVVPMGITFADGPATVDDGSMTKDEFFTRVAEDSKLYAYLSAYFIFFQFHFSIFGFVYRAV